MWSTEKHWNTSALQQEVSLIAGRMQNGWPLYETVWWFLRKLNTLAVGSSNHAPWLCSNELKPCIHARNCNFIHHCLEGSLSGGEWVDRLRTFRQWIWVVLKIETTKPGDNVGKPWTHKAKYKKPIWADRLLTLTQLPWNTAKRPALAGGQWGGRRE